MIAAAERYLKNRSEKEKTRRTAPEGRTVPASSDALVLLRLEPRLLELTPGERFQVSAHLDIRDGWHINAGPTAPDGLIPTTLIVNSDLPVDLLDVVYPEAAPLHLQASDETLDVYQGQVTLRADLRLKPGARIGEEGDLRLRVKYQACDERRCLSPAERTGRVRLKIVQR